MSENTTYDPAAPEGEQSSGGQYLSKKDAKWLVVVSALLVVGLIPVYLYMREKAFQATCVKNMNGIMEAMILYSTQHDDRFPPLYNANTDGEPEEFNGGAPYTWVSDIWPLKSDRVEFVCPSASPDEYSYSANPTGGAPIASTYGFYAPYASYSTLLVDHPETVVILAETSNHGAATSYDPLPYKSSKYDGTVIAWDNSNDWPDENTKLVTRLAFPGSQGGDASKANARHGKHINAISAARTKLFLFPTDMVTDYNPSKYTLSGRWQEPIHTKKK